MGDTPCPTGCGHAHGLGGCSSWECHPPNASDPVTPAGPVVEREVLRDLLAKASPAPWGMEIGTELVLSGDDEVVESAVDLTLACLLRNNAVVLLDAADRCSHLEAALREAREENQALRDTLAIIRPSLHRAGNALPDQHRTTRSGIFGAVKIIDAALDLHPGEDR